uniref:Uncharacterized protein n=1 Tax=Amphimedon queenslandica TaxID=400682 RepID=A0A1X7UH91_AMPQE
MFQLHLGYIATIGRYYVSSRLYMTESLMDRDLGVIMTDDLSWSNHFSLIISKALRILGLLRRSFSPSTPVPVKRLLYLTLVRSKLIYCSVLWRPRLVKDIRRLESVQRRATKWILDDYKTDYKSRLVSLHLLPLMMNNYFALSVGKESDDNHHSQNLCTECIYDMHLSVKVDLHCKINVSISAHYMRGNMTDKYKSRKKHKATK